MVKAQYTDPAVPANSADSYYRHDALVSDQPHAVLAQRVRRRREPPQTSAETATSRTRRSSTASTETASGWTAPGQLAKTSGVSVANGAAGTAPAYTFIDGQTSQVTREYQLCLKCHSGFTTLLANPAGTPTPYSKYRLDKGIELNPANASYHPIEACRHEHDRGDDQPARRDLAVQAVDVHGDEHDPLRELSWRHRKFNATTPPAAGSDLAPHANSYRGILMQNYRDRALMQASDAYNAGNFALCFLCHGEAPFAATGSTARTDTNFRLHGFHLRNIDRGTSTSYDIDRPGRDAAMRCARSATSGSTPPSTASGRSRRTRAW